MQPWWPIATYSLKQEEGTQRYKRVRPYLFQFFNAADKYMGGKFFSLKAQISRWQKQILSSWATNGCPAMVAQPPHCHIIAAGFGLRAAEGKNANFRKGNSRSGKKWERGKSSVKYCTFCWHAAGLSIALFAELQYKRLLASNCLRPFTGLSADGEKANFWRWNSQQKILRLIFYIVLQWKSFAIKAADGEKANFWRWNSRQKLNRPNHCIVIL